MTPRALTVATVSPDRSTLRRLSWLLTAFGYQSLASADVGAVADSLSDGTADLLILDDALPEVGFDNPPLLKRDATQYVYTMLLCDPRQMPNMVDALEWGIDDLLQKPINNGEVLARLRAGARFLEFERRLEQQATRDALTGLLTHSGLVARLRKAAHRPASRAGSYALVVLDLDFFSRIHDRCGKQQADATLIAVAVLLRGMATKRDWVARLGEDRFALVAKCEEPEHAAALAESVREEIASLNSPLGADTRLTASVACTGFDPQQDVPQEVLSRALDALGHAKSSGRNCTVAVGEFDETFAEWRREVNSGNPFAAVIARDVMLPFSYVLQTRADFARIATRLDALSLEHFPIVDKNGALLGMVHRDQLAEGSRDADDGASTTGGLPLQKPFAVTEETPFGELVERFLTEDDPLIVVVRNREPRGYITREGFLNLIEPIHSGSFQPTRPLSQKADYLVVPELVQLDEAV